jgi:hypothetical protein
MFIVIETNPQLYSVADGVKLFHDLDLAARYAMNRGLSNPLAGSLEALKAQVTQPGKAITGGQTGFSVTLLNAESVDAAPNATPPDNVEVEALRTQLLALNNEKTSLEEQLAVAKSELSSAVDAVAVELEESEAEVAELKKKLAIAEAQTPNPESNVAEAQILNTEPTA